MLTPETIHDAPKALLHDHLDGGLRPASIVDLAAEFGYDGLPTTDVEALSAWFRRGADRKSLELYLETFAHTTGVMQERDAIIRVAAECAEDLAADGVAYAEVRYAPELSTERGLTLDEVVEANLDGFRDRRGTSRRGRPSDRHEDRSSPRCARPRARSRSPSARSAGATRASSASTSPAPRPATARRAHLDAFDLRPPRELPHHDPRRRVVRPAVDLGGAPVRAAPSDSGHGVRIVDDIAVRRRRLGASGPARRVRARPARAARDVPDLERPHGRGTARSPSTRSTCSVASATASR